MRNTKQTGGLIKAETGIQGFDAITGGGLPQGRTTLITGGPGSGKTVFALQTFVAAALRGEPGILVTFQESPRQIMENAVSCGWNLPELERDKLVILDSRIRPNVFKSIELYLTGMLAGLRVVATEMGAKWIVFDSIDALFSLLGDRVTERQEIFRLRDWLLESGLTGIITAQVDRDDVVSQRHGILQFTADCVLNLHQHLNGADAARSLRVVKYRGSGFVEREIAFRIGSNGIEMMGPIAALGNPAKLRSKAANSIQKDIAASQATFQARIKSLTHQLEMKQAELDFLLKGRKKSDALPLRPGATAPKPRKSLQTAALATLQRRSDQMASKQA